MRELMSFGKILELQETLIKTDRADMQVINFSHLYPSREWDYEDVEVVSVDDENGVYEFTDGENLRCIVSSPSGYLFMVSGVDRDTVDNFIKIVNSEDLDRRMGKAIFVNHDCVLVCHALSHSSGSVREDSPIMFYEAEELGLQKVERAPDEVCIDTFVGYDFAFVLYRNCVDVVKFNTCYNTAFMVVGVPIEDKFIAMQKLKDEYDKYRNELKGDEVKWRVDCPVCNDNTVSEYGACCECGYNSHRLKELGYMNMYEMPF